uniref:Uncharacterized protein n=1 Tax=Romanomermis culicivorax TaxID=13658 RepID=A0A915KPC6_ROMCU
CCSGFGTDSVVRFAVATEIRDAGQRKPVNDAKNDWRRQCNRLVSTEGRYTGASARFIAQGPLPGIPTDSALKVVSQLKLMNLLDSSSVTEAMRVALTAAYVVLWAPAALRILGPDVAQGALEFIAHGTIHATPVNKILLDSEPSSPAVDAVRRHLQQLLPRHCQQ